MHDTTIDHDLRRSGDALAERASAFAFTAAYIAQLSETLAAVSPATIDKVAQVLAGAADEGRRIFVVGNGGSASIADHVCCDLLKGAWRAGHRPLDAMSLNANTALYSAAANDFGFERVFACQIEMLGKPGDVLLAISSSGDSANIIAAVAAARTAGMTVIGLCGFAGGRLKDMADIVLHAPAANYGIVEDSHMAWIHIVAQLISRRRDAPACG